MKVERGEDTVGDMDKDSVWHTTLTLLWHIERLSGSVGVGDTAITFHGCSSSLQDSRHQVKEINKEQIGSKGE